MSNVKCGMAKPSTLGYMSEYGALQPTVHEILKGVGNYFYLANGSKIFDAVGGAAVTNIGHQNQEVKKAICDQLDAVEYCRSTLFTAPVSSKLAAKLVASTGGAMARAMILSSGTEAMDAALKLCILYYKTIGQPQRVRFIARQGSYHGSSVSTLALGHHKRRRAMYHGLLAHDGLNFSHVSRAHAFRDCIGPESESAYVARLAQELEEEFQRNGPETICAFVAEPIVGSGLGGATAPKGYFEAMKEVCRRHGALLIMDEVMCGLGRSGTYHAWQHPDIDVVPDLQTVGKTLGGGYVPIAALLIGSEIAKVMETRCEFFVHGATYEDHPVSSAAALAVQKIVDDENLVSNVQIQGVRLLSQLKARLGNHPCVCHIRGRGLFLGVEIAMPGRSKPYPSAMKVAYRIRDAGLILPCKTQEALGIDGISLFPMQGCADGLEGDVVMLMPAYNVNSDDIEVIAEAFAVAVEETLGPTGGKLSTELPQQGVAMPKVPNPSLFGMALRQWQHFARDALMDAAMTQALSIS